MPTYIFRPAYKNCQTYDLETWARDSLDDEELNRFARVFEELDRLSSHDPEWQVFENAGEYWPPGAFVKDSIRPRAVITIKTIKPIYEYMSEPEQFGYFINRYIQDLADPEASFTEVIDN
jgi:hypothetical protein